MDRKCAGGDFECFTYAEFGEGIEVGNSLEERDAGELIEQSDFVLIGDEEIKSGDTFSFEAAVILKHDGLKAFTNNGEI